MPLADDTQAEIDLLAGTAELRRQLESVKHQRDTWQRMAETAARSVQDLTAARDALQQQVRELLATPRALRVVCPNCRESTENAPPAFPASALRTVMATNSRK